MSGRLVLLAFPFLATLPAPVPAQVRSSACEDAVRERLGAFEGRWRVEAVFRAGESAWDSTTAVATITPELSGCLLREEYRGTRYGEPYAYIALWGANGLEDAPYQRTFAHSQHGLLTLRAGDFTGDTLVLRSTTLVRGQAILEEDRITRPTASRFTLINRRSTDDGATWTTTRRAVYVRSRDR
ncbi:MAG: hypothetical protein PVH00_09575 [Gemmatimonadota bacterium]|jgi:hypothetical protein